MEIVSARYVLAVPDAAASASWWVEVMGFELQFEVEGWRFVGRDGCRIMLGSCPDDLRPAELGSHSYFAYLVVDDVDAFHTEIASRSALVRSPPTDREWGMREMAVQTPDGHRLTVGQPVA